MKHILTIALLLFTVALFGQRTRLKLNQLEKGPTADSTYVIAAGADSLAVWTLSGTGEVSFTDTLRSATIGTYNYIDSLFATVSVGSDGVVTGGNFRNDSLMLGRSNSLDSVYIDLTGTSGTADGYVDTAFLRNDTIVISRASPLSDTIYVTGLDAYLDNTDAQTLSFANPNLTISGGNSVDLSSLTPDLAGYVQYTDTARTATVATYTYVDSLNALSATQSALVDTAAAIRADFPTLSESDPIFSASVANDITATDTTQWATAYDNMVTAIGVSGTTTKTITLTQQDAGTLTANFTDEVDDADADPTNENQTVSAGWGIDVANVGEDYEVTADSAEVATLYALQDSSAAIRADFPATPDLTAYVQYSDTARAATIGTYTYIDSLFATVSVGTDGVVTGGTVRNDSLILGRSNSLDSVRVDLSSVSGGGGSSDGYVDTLFIRNDTLVVSRSAPLSDTIYAPLTDLNYLTTETNDLTAAVVWANVPDANITESSVTQHQAALSITESQISDLSHFGGAVNDLTDAFNSTPSDGHVLVYDGVTDNRYENRALVEADISDFGTYLETAATDNTISGDGTSGNTLKVDTTVIASLPALQDTAAAIRADFPATPDLTGYIQYTDTARAATIGTYTYIDSLFATVSSGTDGVVTGGVVRDDSLRLGRSNSLDTVLIDVSSLAGGGSVSLDTVQYYHYKRNLGGNVEVDDDPFPWSVGLTDDPYETSGASFTWTSYSGSNYTGYPSGLLTRSSPSSSVWAFPVNNGRHTINIVAAAVGETATGNIDTDIVIEGDTVLNGYDSYDAHADTAFVLTFSKDVTDGELNMSITQNSGNTHIMAIEVLGSTTNSFLEQVTSITDTVVFSMSNGLPDIYLPKGNLLALNEVGDPTVSADFNLVANNVTFSTFNSGYTRISAHHFANGSEQGFIDIRSEQNVTQNTAMSLYNTNGNNSLRLGGTSGHGYLWYQTDPDGDSENTFSLGFSTVGEIFRIKTNRDVQVNDGTSWKNVLLDNASYLDRSTDATTDTITISTSEVHLQVATENQNSNFTTTDSTWTPDLDGKYRIHYHIRFSWADASGATEYVESRFAVGGTAQNRATDREYRTNAGADIWYDLQGELIHTATGGSTEYSIRLVGNTTEEIEIHRATVVIEKIDD